MLEVADRPAVVARPWLAGYDPDVPVSLDYPDVRLDGLLRRSAARYPDQPALVFYGRATTYRELDDAVDRLAGGFHRLGLRPGDRVALFMPNCPQLVASFSAIWRAGCVAVPVNPRASGPELSRQLADAGAAAAIVLDRLWLRLRDVALPETLRSLVVADAADDLPFALRLGARIQALTSPRGSVVAEGAEVLRFRELARRGRAPTAAPAAGRRDPAPEHQDPAGPGRAGPGRAGPGPDDPAVLLYTGGTTGLPKAAILTHRNLVANACQLAAWASSLDDGAEVMLSALPLAHGYAMTACMNISVLRGWTQVLVPDPRDLERLLDEIERWRVTVFPGVPTLYAAICDHPEVASGKRNLHSIEACISGAAALPAGIEDEFERLTGGRLVEGYGLSEASPATHCNPLGMGDRNGAIGLPLPDTDCRLVDVETETHEVGPGEPGVLCISGPQVM
ncbi:MAG TPA: AMP-binding protein, partial [Candidatus Limnocylindrales bacterium]|nr:AMP-binding protein [Candidatus Limnocylindrales bacterium]